LYYYYNITKIIDALDAEQSDCEFWCSPPTTGEINHFAFREDRLEGVSVFRIPEDPMLTIVTDQFVRRAQEFQLGGFEFKKIWPLPKGTNWRLEPSIKLGEQGSLKQHTLLIVLTLTSDSLSATEHEQISALETRIESVLSLSNSNAEYVGYYAGRNIVGSQYRMFLPCPDVDVLFRVISPVVVSFQWSKRMFVVRRFGNMYDAKASEKIDRWN
jgi:hypothetical protein